MSPGTSSGRWSHPGDWVYDHSFRVWEVLSPWRSYDARDRVLKVESPWRLWMFPPRTVSGDGGHPGECTYVTPGALSARGTCWCLWTCDPGGSFWVLFSPWRLLCYLSPGELFLELGLKSWVASFFSSTNEEMIAILIVMNRELRNILLGFGWVMLETVDMWLQDQGLGGGLPLGTVDLWLQVQNFEGGVILEVVDLWHEVQIL